MAKAHSSTAATYGAAAYVLCACFALRTLADAHCSGTRHARDLPGSRLSSWPASAGAVPAAGPVAGATPLSDQPAPAAAAPPRRFVAAMLGEALRAR